MFSCMTAFGKEAAILPASCAPRCSTYRRLFRAVNGGYPTVRHSINPQRPCEPHQTLIFNLESGLKPFSHNSGHVFAFRKQSDSLLDFLSYYPTPFYETCVSSEFMTFWATKSHTPLAPPVTAGETIFATQANLNQIKLALTTRLLPSSQPLSLAPGNSPSFSTVDVWHGDSTRYDPRHSVSIRHPLVKHLPSSSIAPHVIHAKPSEPGLSGCPFSRRERRADKVAAPLRVFQHAYLTTPDRHDLYFQITTLHPKAERCDLERNHFKSHSSQIQILGTNTLTVLKRTMAAGISWRTF